MKLLSRQLFPSLALLHLIACPDIKNLGPIQVNSLKLISRNVPWLIPLCFNIECVLRRVILVATFGLLDLYYVILGACYELQGT